MAEDKQRRVVVRKRLRTALLGGPTLAAAVVIGLAVLVFTAILTMQATMHVSPVEGRTWEMGAADARIRDLGYSGNVTQDYSVLAEIRGISPGHQRTFYSAQEINALLPQGSRVVPFPISLTGWREEFGELDLRDPLTRGMYPLISGRYPQADGELVVKERVANQVRSEIASFDPESKWSRLVVVGVTADIVWRDSPDVIAFPGTGVVNTSSSGSVMDWLVDTPGPVTWGQVKNLNSRGLYVLSRAVITNPRADNIDVGQGRLSDLMHPDSSGWLVCCLLVNFVIVYPVVAVAFAYRTFRHRKLGLLATLAAVPVGVGLGLTIGAWVLLRFSDSVPGPYEIPLMPVLAAAGISVAIALLAIPTAFRMINFVDHR
ncbi:hypothetical protein [Planotetraspora sp. GP83]|uniref:hypothetical protein n=1 Tax=Planotetraspora sp. GP83 TaxID=3156264 RepID=UPI003513238A